MAIKIENQATIKVPKKTEEVIQSVFEIIPREHQRGLSRVVLVDRIKPEGRLPRQSGGIDVSDLPGRYYPKQGISQPWCEIAIAKLTAGDGFFQRLAARLNYKPNLAYLVFSLQAQHYYLTLSHGIKKNQLENAIRGYIEKHHAVWREQQAGWRANLFKPLRPYLDKWAKKLRKRYMEEQQRRKPA